MLLAFTAIVVVQTTREIVSGTSLRWHESHMRADTFVFASRHVAIVRAPDVASAKPHGEVDQERVLIDGTPVGESVARRLVKWPLGDGRRSPHWLTITKFVSRDARDSSVWIARRLQRTDAESPRIDVVTIDATGAVRAQVHDMHNMPRTYQLTTAAWLVAEDHAPMFPFSVLPLAWFGYLFLALPIVTGVLGVVLLRRRPS